MPATCQIFESHLINVQILVNFNYASWRQKDILKAESKIKKFM
jgi:hypothetical protein